MGMPVRIDDYLYEQAKAHAHAERRTREDPSLHLSFQKEVTDVGLDSRNISIRNIC